MDWGALRKGVGCTLAKRRGDRTIKGGATRTSKAPGGAGMLSAFPARGLGAWGLGLGAWGLGLTAYGLGPGLRLGLPARPHRPPSRFDTCTP
ncbi:hypothetical protein F7Q96_17755 [Cupriavidus gilardii]|nr:hypothetical protein F7Q96_17755 [Cupriavidus gilardii]